MIKTSYNIFGGINEESKFFTNLNIIFNDINDLLWWWARKKC